MFRFFDQTAVRARINPQDLTHVLSQDSPANIAERIARCQVKAKRWMTISILVSVRIDTGAMQPISHLLEALTDEVRFNRAATARAVVIAVSMPVTTTKTYSRHTTFCPA
jgi:hypothetical protein